MLFFSVTIRGGKGTNLIICAQKVSEENYKPLVKEIKELSKWRGILCS